MHLHSFESRSQLGIRLIVRDDFISIKYMTRKIKPFEYLMVYGCGTESMHNNETQLIMSVPISYRTAGGVPQGGIIGAQDRVFTEIT